MLKSTAPARLLESLKEVVDGARRCRRRSPAGRQALPRRSSAGRASYHLTPQERTLLKLIVEGHHYKTAAHEMGISVNTVSFHLKNIYEKLQVHSKTEAVAKALRDSLINRSYRFV